MVKVDALLSFREQALSFTSGHWIYLGRLRCPIDYKWSLILSRLHPFSFLQTTEIASGRLCEAPKKVQFINTGFI